MRLNSDLHLGHGLSELLQLVGRGQGFQADVSQLHVLVPQRLLQSVHVIVAQAVGIKVNRSI